MKAGSGVGALHCGKCFTKSQKAGGNPKHVHSEKKSALNKRPRQDETADRGPESGGDEGDLLADLRWAPWCG